MTLRASASCCCRGFCVVKDKKTLRQVNKRARRIKCDETYPVCKKCMIRNRPCHYNLRWRGSVTDVQDENDSGYAVRQHVVKRTTVPPPDQMPPIEWELMQGLRYYTTVLPLIYAVPPDTSPNTMHRISLRMVQTDRVAGFLLTMVRHQICCLYAAHGVPAIRPDELPGMAHLWSRLFELMNKSLQAINYYIMNDSAGQSILSRIIEVMCAELAIMDAPWRKHLRGFLAIVKHHGGVDAIFNFVDPPYRGLQFGLVHGVVGNTVSSVQDQVSEINDWNDADVMRVYTRLYFNGFSCPSRMFLAIHHITQLRVAAAALDCAIPISDDLFITAASIAREIRDFSASLWSETYQIPPQPLIALYGRVYQAAAGIAMGDVAARWHQRTILFQAIEEARGPLKAFKCGTWPLAVLGVAYHDGTPDEHATIIRLLMEAHRNTTNADCGAGMLMRDLSEFWASGRTGWDDCFYKPSHALT
ncbi:hypothetical protein NLG97_g7631 [Lecanicillium saksenae]|uniref:Uncharacterized protein n=1 Tax=Lecanicillium saksenae TaxID=468837 RepID=A0ACC1QP80_9HYPO|nr:hypothetical protein NLG97_g7631 [Lecanicillium saksenae]